jgi:hypothetical protein
MVTKKRIKIPIFNYYVTVIVFDVWEDLKGYIPEEIYQVPARGYTINYDDHCVVLCSPRYHSSIVHEAGHIKNLIWAYIGYTPHIDNDEVDQYLHTYIYEEIVKIEQKHLGKLD